MLQLESHVTPGLEGVIVELRWDWERHYYYNLVIVRMIVDSVAVAGRADTTQRQHAVDHTGMVDHRQPLVVQAVDDTDLPLGVVQHQDDIVVLLVDNIVTDGRGMQEEDADTVVGTCVLTNTGTVVVVAIVAAALPLVFSIPSLVAVVGDAVLCHGQQATKLTECARFHPSVGADAIGC